MLHALRPIHLQQLLDALRAIHLQQLGLPSQQPEGGND